MPTAQKALFEPPSLVQSGRPISSAGGNAAIDSEEEVLRTIRAQLLKPLVIVAGSGASRQTFSLSTAQLGVEIDRTRLRQFLRDVDHPVSPTNLKRARSSSPSRDKPLQIITPLRLNTERATAILLSLKKQLDQVPINARLNPLGGPPLRESIGRRLDLDASLLAIRQAVEAGNTRVELVFRTTIPHRLASQLEGVVQTTTLGEFETPYDRSRRAQARTFNLRLAASHLDGTILLPDDVFDFNAVVGPRDEANGYQVASVIAQGEVVDGIGGGTCQISGTLHAAALLAGLDIVERTPHTRPSAYIKLGFDATVVYPTINLRLRNPYDFAVVLHETVNDGLVKVRIVGPKRPHRITIIRKIDKGFPFERVERPDPSLPSGMRVVSQRGVPGLTLHRYRVRATGAHSTREKTIDRYPPTAEVVRVGTGEPNAAAKLAALSPQEYLPDELLVLAQQEDPSAPLLITRKPGRYGIAGWSANLRQLSP